MVQTKIPSSCLLPQALYDRVVMSKHKYPHNIFTGPNSARLSPENAFLDMIFTLITGRAAEQQLGPAEAAVSGRENKIDLL